MGFARVANRFFNDEEPWATRKTDEARCRTTIAVALQTCASLSILCEPFLPATARAIRDMLQLTGVRSSERAEGRQGLGWEHAKQDLLVGGRPLGEPTILFKKIEDEAIVAQIEKLHARRKPA
jgi:methionyl-tRNA synthetase